ncbi:MAG: chemotaxis protein CheB [Nitrospiria bacterium]
MRSEWEGLGIVGIGASAGGLEALEAFFRQMPADSGLAFVVVQHLDPGHKSIMVDLLARRTAMKVLQVADGMRVTPNSVYVIPPHKYLALLQDVLHLLDPDPRQTFRLPIDVFFRSLSEDKGEKAIGIVLSGTGTDGALGIKAVKGSGGMTMAQDEGSAKFSSMPKSAIATGCVDYVVPPEQMPRELMKYIRHPYMAAALRKDREAPDLAEPDRLDKIFILLRSHTGHDFSQYKRNTISRRIERRMAVHQLEHIDDYIRYLRDTKPEIDALFKDLLIGVTSFFRDPEAFETLREQVVRPLVARQSAETPIRVWVAGCSTGEEAYSLAMLLREEIVDTSTKNLKIQIFATDIDRHALDIAREGIYPDSIAADVSPQRLTRFFTKEGAHYRINQPIRDTVVFAKQDLIKDPPFSKLDLIVCRNLLIYMTNTLQRKILPLFHYTLNPMGYLMLGPSETVGDFVDLFALTEKKWKIFQAKHAVRPVEFPLMPQTLKVMVATRGGVHALGATNLAQRFEKLLLEDHTPPCVIVNAKYDILHFHGQTRGYLNPPTGAATFNLLKMAREGLRIELRTALHKAFRDHTRVVHAAIRVGGKGTPRTVNLVIEPLEQEFVAGLMLVIFEEATTSTSTSTSKKHTSAQKEADRPHRLIEDLENELNSTRETLQTTIEELDNAKEEFTATNEELQSTNEEFQSTNEELETSKEEMQSVNEELLTVNTELQSKLDELSQVHNDIQNLLNSTQIGTIFLDTRLRIKRFTPMAGRVFSLIPGDVGRPLNHLASHLVDDKIVSDAGWVLQTLAVKEQERQTKEGEWFLMRMVPYRTMTNVIDGIVITFTDISELKKQKRAAEASARYAEGIIGAMWDPLLVLNKTLQVVSANTAYYDTFGIGKHETEGRLVYELGNGQWNIPDLKRLLEEILPQNSTIDNFEMEHTFQQIGRKKMSVKARRLILADKDKDKDKDKDELILLAIRDLTPRDHP